MLEVGKKCIVQDMLLNITVTRETGSLGVVARSKRLTSAVSGNYFRLLLSV